jgi:type II secretory pathway component PulC
MKSSVRRFFFVFSAVLAIVAAAAALSRLVAGRVAAGREGASLPSIQASAPDSAARSTDVAQAISALCGVMEESRTGAGKLSARFRLAGTILGSTETGAGEPMAILDDREEVRQRVVVRSFEVVPGVVLSAVGSDFATLRGPGGEETLMLEKAQGARNGGGQNRAPGAAASLDVPASAGNDREKAAARFGGTEVFPDRWRFDRDKVVEYYEELRAEPERLLAVFDSMDPVYEENDGAGERTIGGYRVGVEGESDFFLAAGLENGDIVRKVNSLEMSRRDRAESLIAAFIEGRASMFVFEIERDGETKKVVFEIE